MKDVKGWSKSYVSFQEGFGIIVTNGNQNYDGRKGSIKVSQHINTVATQNI